MYIKNISIDFLGNQNVSYVNTETGDCFPESDKNRHYLEYLKWIEEGNVAEVKNIDAPVCEVK